MNNEPFKSVQELCEYYENISIGDSELFKLIILNRFKNYWCKKLGELKAYENELLYCVPKENNAPPPDSGEGREYSLLRDCTESFEFKKHGDDYWLILIEAKGVFADVWSWRFADLMVKPRELDQIETEQNGIERALAQFSSQEGDA